MRSSTRPSWPSCSCSAMDRHPLVVLHGLPQGEAERRLALLDAVDAVGVDDEAVVRRRPTAPSRRRRSRRGRREQAPLTPPPRRRRARCARCRWSRTPTAMSAGVPWAMIWRPNTRSNPTSLPSAVSTAWSSTRHRAGNDVPHGGCVEQLGEAGGVGGAPAVAEGEQPAAARRSARAMASAAAWTADAAARRVAARSAALVVALATAETARSSSRAAGSPPSSSPRNG